MRKTLIGFALTALLHALCAPVWAQQPKKIPRIEVLIPSAPSFALTRLNAFREGLRDLGYVEGKSVVFEYRYAEGKPERLMDLASELVRLKVDLVYTASEEGVLAAKNASKTVPIVFGTVQDPLASGFVESLARPGGNATGLSAVAPDLGGKRLELLKEAVPRVSRVAFFSSPPNPGANASLKETQAAAQALGLQLQSLEVRDRTDFERTFDATLKERAQAFTTAPAPLSIMRAYSSWVSPPRTVCRQCTRRLSLWMAVA